MISWNTEEHDVKFIRLVFFDTLGCMKNISIMASKLPDALEEETQKLRKKLDEIRLIDRAKCVLIEYEHLTERQAHRYLEKQAMDGRLSRRDVAVSLLREYEEKFQTST